MFYLLSDLTFYDPVKSGPTFVSRFTQKYHIVVCNIWCFLNIRLQRYFIFKNRGNEHAKFYILTIII